MRKSNWDCGGFRKIFRNLHVEEVGFDTYPIGPRTATGRFQVREARALLIDVGTERRAPLDSKPDLIDGNGYEFELRSPYLVRDTVN